MASLGTLDDVRAMEKQQTDWISRRAGARSEDQPASGMERLRRDLAAFQSTAGSWEAACLKSVADLLDSLDKARGEQEALSSRLAELHADLEVETEEREHLKDTVAEFEGKVREVVRIRAERDVLLSHVDDGAATLAEAQTELEQLRAKVAAAEAGRDEWNAALQKVQSSQTELEETHDKLAAAEKERDEAIAERDQLTRRLEDYESVKKKLRGLRTESEALNRRAEETLIEMCDLRVQLNRLETDRDEAVRDRRTKVKKILSKVHAALDEAGAPGGEDLSYGERIRWLRNQLES